MTDIIEVNRDCFNQGNPKDTVHDDELVKVIKIDDIGKRYVILAKGSNPRKDLSGITFHTGNPADGINGISIESLLAICKDRLETFNANGFDCIENNMAIGHIAAAITAMEHRQGRRKEENKAGSQEK